MITTCLKTDIGKVRSANEDAIGETTNALGRFVVVCDGMGGHFGGRVASQTALDKILQTIEKEATKEEPPIQKDALLQLAFEQANRELQEKARDLPEYKMMGTTAVVAWVQKNELFCGYLGDSRLYLWRGKKLKRCTKDHSYVQEMVDAGKITPEEAERHPERNMITRALLAYETLEEPITTDSFILQPGDVVLLCTDGLNDMILSDDIAAILSYADSLETAAQQLIDAANQVGGHDNISVGLLAYH